MKTTKLISTALAAVMIMATMQSSNVIAETNDYVYSAVDADGTIVGYTQAELDSAHWDTEKLGSENPVVYEEFPAKIWENVSEFSDLSISVKYMKSSVDSANLSVIDLSNNETVFNSSVADGEVETQVLPIGKSYQFKLTETINGETKEYNKIVNTITEEVEMPEYVTNHNTDCETVVLVGDVADLKASIQDNGNGDFEIISGAKRFEQVKACELGAYLETLKENTIYKIYTSDESEAPYLGYMSTYSNGEELGIYMPTIELVSWEAANAPQTYSLPTPVTSAAILAKTATNISQYQDYLFYTKDSTGRYFDVMKFEIPSIVSGSYATQFTLKVNASDAVTIESWIGEAGSTTLTKTRTVTYSTGSRETLCVLDYFGAGELEMGDYIYFVVYFSNISYGKGYLSFIETSDTYTDDVIGSRYQAYENKSGTSLITPANTSYYYTTTDYRDVDSFYINYSGAETRKIRITLNNKRQVSDTARKKYLEVFFLVPDTVYDTPDIYSAGDLFEVDVDEALSYDVYPHSGYECLFSVRDYVTSNTIFKNINVDGEGHSLLPHTYSIWVNFK